jgi:hypothetical protein
MMARMGHVLYWTATAFAMLMLAAVAYGSASCWRNFDLSCAQTSLPRGIVGVFAIGIWLLGIACRYVLAGPTRRGRAAPQ